MTTYNKRTTYSAYPVDSEARMRELMEVPADQFIADRLVYKSVQIDCTDQEYAADDVIQLFDVPAGAFVLALAVDVETAEGATATTEIGDASDPNGFAVAHNLNSAVKSCCMPGALSADATPVYVPAHSQGVFYAAAGVISMIPDHALDAAVFTVSILYVKMF